MTKRDTILIVTNRFDEHASHVIKVLNELSIPVFRLNTEDFPREVTLRWHSDVWELQYHGRTLTPEIIRSCWYRRPSDAIAHEEITDTGHQQFVQDECNYTLNGLYRSIENVIWVSHPDALQAAKYKAQQLYLARRLGFTVPETLITNDPNAFRDFFSRHHNRVIVKIAGRGPTTLQPDQIIYTTLLTAASLEHAEEIRFAPHLFQQYIEKQYEVRVTVIGDKIFAVRIDSQKNESTRVDWRHYDFANTPHTAMTLPPEVEERCLTMVARYGLMFGAIDLIVTPDNKWVFLEINPNGQWLWLEELTGLPMTDALIEILTKKME